MTGLPSDDAVLDSVVAGDGGDPSQVDRVTIGFNAVASLAAGKVAAATGFRNAEAVTLRRRGVPVRVFRVDRYGAPRFPELVLCTSEKTLKSPTRAGPQGRQPPPAGDTASSSPTRGSASPTCSPRRRGSTAPISSLSCGCCSRPSLRVGRFVDANLRSWAAWALRHGILERPLDVSAAFPAQSS